MSEKTLELSHGADHLKQLEMESAAQLTRLRERLHDRETELGSSALVTDTDPDRRVTRLREEFDREKEDYMAQITVLKEKLDNEQKRFAEFKESVKKQFDERKQQV